MKVRLRQSLKLSLILARFLCHLEKHKFNKHGYMHHFVEMIKLKHKKVYEIFFRFQTNHKFTAYTDNLQSQLMPKAYRYFTPMSSWTSDARRPSSRPQRPSTRGPVIPPTLKRVTAQTSTL